MAPTVIPRYRGFGLTDVALGVVAGIGMLAAATYTFQEVSTLTTFTEVSRKAFSISEKIRAASRNHDDFIHLTNGVQWQIDLENFGIDPVVLRDPLVTAHLEGTGDVLVLAFHGVSERICNRSSVNTARLGTRVDYVACRAGTMNVAYGF